MRFPIAMIPYANMAPYEAMGPPADCYFVHCTPRNSIAALKEGAVWAAAVPVGGLAALEGVVRPVGLFGIAAYREVMSVLFFSDRPIDQFTSALSVRLTDESASSVRLLYLLLGQACGFGRMPLLAPAGAPANGELVIGDTALSWHHVYEGQAAVKGFNVMTDLAAQWDRVHGLPFVFARWVIRCDAPVDLQQRMDGWLHGFKAAEPELIERSVPRVAMRLQLPYAYVRRYLKVIRRCLTPSDQAGQALFLDGWRRQGASAANPWFPEERALSAHRTHAHE